MIQHPRPASSQGLGEHQGGRCDTAFLVAHLNAAYNLARCLVGDQTDAEDVVQDAYLRAVSYIEGFRGGDGRAWLLTIVRNICYSRRRRKGASGQDTDFDELVHSAAVDRQTPNAETVLLQAERTELVWKSLASLPAEYREVLVLRELEQLSYREITQVARIPLGTVMSRLSRARQRLQQTLLDSKFPVSAVRHPVDC
jgi:RNA polymerase sigma-70 factor (ECF subfamily)